MDKEELISKLKNQLGSTQLSERTIGVYADTLLASFKDDSVYTDDFIKTQAGFLKSMNGQLHSDVSAQAEEYKRKNPTAKPAQQEQSDDMKAILESLTQIKNENALLKQQYEADKAAAAKKAVIADVRSKLAEQIRTKTGRDANQFVLDTTMGGIELKDGDTADSLLESVGKSYDENIKKVFAGYETGIPSFGAGSPSQEESQKQIDDFFSQKASEGKFPKAE